MLHEPILLGSGADAVGDGQRADQALHQEFSGEGEDNDVEGDKGEVVDALPVVGGRVRIMAGVSGYERVSVWKRVGEEDSPV